MNCQDVLLKIDEINDEYLNILEDVCNLESPTADKARVDAVGLYFVRMAKARGWEIEIASQERAGDVVTITLNPHAKTAPIVLSGHIDTVHPVGSFGSPAVRRDDKRMYGPGVMDCKGGVVAAFMAMDALAQCGFSSRPVHLILQTDEETGSRTSNKATIAYMCEKSKDAIAFLNLEGHLSGTAALIRKGILQYRFKVRGKALHSSRCYDAANAIAEAASKILRLEKMKDRNGLTCNCGLIHGGTVANTVAEECEFVADIRFGNKDQLHVAREKVRRIAHTYRIDGCSCEYTEINFRPAMPLCEQNEALLAKMNEIYQSVGLPVLAARECPSGSDAAYITEAGIPCVDCIGTEGRNIHSVDEYIELCSLAESAKRIAAVVAEI
ncbi:MAG: M20/M25/M40 family metallo-hydrolase [Clostridia bacterium]|nr:M20/M25/M40 family metallo-hydrolase [Clostridia bacterium]